MTHRVEFTDTDAAGIIHFSTYFRWMEITEHAFFRSRGLSVWSEFDGRRLGWPRVHASCDFKLPVRFEDEVEARLVLRERGDKALTFEIAFHRLTDQAEIGRGRLTTVCVEQVAGTMRAVTIPSFITERLEAPPEESN